MTRIITTNTGPSTSNKPAVTDAGPTTSINIVNNDPHPYTSPNKTILQAFEWYQSSPTTEVWLDPATGIAKDLTISHWSRLTSLLPALKLLGITSLWIPPACKATYPGDNGYGIHDLYDLGEFKAVGHVSTKWGTKAELQSLCSQAKELRMAIIFDAVLNHRAAADASEDVEVVRVDPEHRNKEIKGSKTTIEAWTKFNFEGRKGKYSSLRYNKSHFSGIDWDSKTSTKAIFKIIEKRPDGSRKDWAEDVGTNENGNYDYLMFADVDYGNVEVQNDVINWGKWLVDTLPGMRGIRLDASKHYSASFQKAFIKEVTKHADRTGNDQFFFVGEYWLPKSRFLSRHIDRTFGGNIHLFDVQLVYNLSDISKGRSRDLRNVLKGTLLQLQPTKAITFVANHDTQESQSLAAPVDDWFVPHAYALILLRKEGHPNVFWGDIFGVQGPHAKGPACGGRLMRIVKARELFAYGDQIDHISKDVNKDPHCIAWSRKWHGTSGEDLNMVTVLSTSWAWKKVSMNVGKKCAGQIWTDIMGWSWSAVQIDEDGWGSFPVGPRSMGIWTWKDAERRKEVDGLIYPPEPEVKEETPSSSGSEAGEESASSSSSSSSQKAG